ncbi:hypothetical protein N7471_003140 [Penicillium samsonianum]|uniref:uncharacterized protein n=1 Tax=Penicillium samsonianum TaxID=1882272 RepID=UPI002546FF9A|nr:uncharacterized protein N7471_003140 [Penicillium samsonianum]KAJ6143687.1 hypothetical protein N7471_003140 [Penicillium samsonianum]
MLSALADRGSTAEGDVMLVLATKEAKVMLGLMRESLKNISLAVNVKVDIFTDDDQVDLKEFNKQPRIISVHRGRLSPGHWVGIPKNIEAFICGPNDFGDSVTKGLLAAGLPLDQIHREGFY